MSFLGSRPGKRNPTKKRQAGDKRRDIRRALSAQGAARRLKARIYSTRSVKIQGHVKGATCEGIAALYRQAIKARSALLSKIYMAAIRLRALTMLICNRHIKHML